MKYACLQESYPRCDYQLWYRKDDEIFEEEVSIMGIFDSILLFKCFGAGDQIFEISTYDIISLYPIRI